MKKQLSIEDFWKVDFFILNNFREWKSWRTVSLKASNLLSDSHI